MAIHPIQVHPCMASNDDHEDNDERTEMLYGYDEIMDKVMYFFAHMDKTLDICSEGVGASYVASNEVLMKSIFDFVRRGGKFRLVIEITEDNIAACKEMMKVADVRHLEGIMNSFALTEKYYFCHVTQEPS